MGRLTEPRYSLCAARVVLCAGLWWALGGAGEAAAQVDARQLYQEAKTAYEAGRFDAARDAAATASQNDPNNPEVFVLLGKAHYQLGELDKAIAAWQRAVTLAPEQAFVKQMLDVLRGARADYDARLKFVRLLVDQRLFDPAAQECAKLLAEAALGDGQRAAVWLLQAEIAVGRNQPAEALRALGLLRVRGAEGVDPGAIDLWEGVAKLRAGGASAAEGLALLESVRKLPGENPAVAVAEYELAVFRLSQGVTPERAEELAAWLAAHPAHRLSPVAAPVLLSAYLALAGQAGAPEPQAEPGAWDLKAKSLLEQLAAGPTPAAELIAAHHQWLKHVEEHYAARGAFAAAARLVEMPAGEGAAAGWPREVRRAALAALGRYRSELAARDLDRLARVGQLPADGAAAALPQPLADAAAVYETLGAEFPDQPAWNELADLAARVRSSSARVPASPAGTTLKAPDAWAAELAARVVRARVDAAAVQKAVELFGGLIHDYSQPADAAAQSLRVELSRRLLAAPLADDHPAWPGAMVRHAELLAGHAHFLFAENLKTGKAAENAKPSPLLDEWLETVGRLVARDAAQAAAARELGARLVEPWHRDGHAAVVDAVFGKLVELLPATEQRAARLAWAELEIDRVAIEHRRLRESGLRVPRRLDPRHVVVLQRLYQLQAGLANPSAELAEVRRRWQSIPAYYEALEYPDIARQAAEVKAEPAVAAADEFAAFTLLALGEREARDELARHVDQYGAKDKLALSPALGDALDGWEKFITDHADSPLMRQAVERILGIGRLYEQHQAFDVAAAVYARLAKFAAGVPALAEAPPTAANTVEEVSFTWAGALEAHARKLFAKFIAERKSDDPPPAELSAEFGTAIEAYKQCIAARPDGPRVGQAVDRILGIATEYAARDAWPVSESIVEGLLNAKLDLARPERLKFALGVCRLGRAMPDHAREVLAMLTSGGWRGSGPLPDISALALDDRSAEESRADLAMGDKKADGAPVGGWAVPGPGRPESNAGAVSARPAEEPMAQPAPPPVQPPADMPPGATRMPAAPPVVSQAEALRDSQLLAMIRRQESQRAQQVAQLRERVAWHEEDGRQAAVGNELAQQSLEQLNRQVAAPAAVLSEAERNRQREALSAAYEVFQSIRADYPTTPTAEQARGEILLMVAHWRELSEWEEAAGLAGRYLADNPSDREVPKLRLEIARDRLAWAAGPARKPLDRQAMLAEVSRRFGAARQELARVVADFPGEKSLGQEAQWDLAMSFLTEARVIAALSTTLARGQFVRAANELRAVVERHADHPRIGEIGSLLWNIASELEQRGFDEEAIAVLSDLIIYDPLGDLAPQAAMRIAETYRRKLNRPLKAAEVYQEQFFATGAADQGLQDAIFQIGSELKDQKRWVEAMHVLEVFVDSFPRHPQAGQALSMVGQIHQTNEAWEDAIRAYQRVIADFGGGPFVQEAKWAIAECTINLSRWQEAIAAYRDFAAAYPQDGRVAEANRRIEILKDLVRYQGLVDEKDQRKAFDAQYQIAEIVRKQLNNPVKAIIEYRKVVAGWPDSHLADDALYEVGTSYLGLDETEKGRQALAEMAQRYPSSPLADDALFLIGRSHEDEAQRFATITRETTLARNWEVTQRSAYEQVQSSRRKQEESLGKRVAALKSEGKEKDAEVEEASAAGRLGQFNDANVRLFAQKAQQDVEAMTAAQLADRQDKTNAALRKAVEAYQRAAQVAGADKADDALLQMATIYDEQLKDSKAAMQTWLEIVRQFSGTNVAEDASWRIAQYHEREANYAEAAKAYEQFLRNYRRSPKAGDAQFAIAENYERLGQWVAAMDAYTNYINNFPEGPLVAKAKEQINWIKTYRL